MCERTHCSLRASDTNLTRSTEARVPCKSLVAHITMLPVLRLPAWDSFQSLRSVCSSSTLHYLSPIAARSGLHVLSAQQENNFNNLRFIRSVYSSQYNNWFQLSLDAGPRPGSTVVLAAREQTLPVAVFVQTEESGYWPRPRIQRLQHPSSKCSRVLITRILKKDTVNLGSWQS